MIDMRYRRYCFPACTIANTGRQYQYDYL